MPLVSANGVQIHLTDTGAAPGLPDAPVVVFGHGLLFSGWMFQAQMEALRPSYRCVAIDWRGQGKTPPTDDGYDMDTLYADAAAVIEGLDVGPVHYAGLSMGGFVGMRLAARRPDLLRSLVLLDTSAGPEDPEKVSRYRLLATVYGLIGMRPLRSQVNPIMFARGSLASAAFKPVVDEWYSQLGSQDRRGV
jgi:3-oxoadipate enol-lactonase